MYNGFSPEPLSRGEFGENLALEGSGGAMENQGVAGLVLDAVVFYKNKASSAANTANAGAMLNASSSVKIVNAIFHGNTSNKDGGSITNKGGSIEIVNSTFARNVGGTNGGVSNEAATAVIRNSILWQNTGGELKGTGFTVTFSTVTGGFAGTGNKSADPLFANLNDPQGADGDFGDLDDGLRLGQASPAVNAGTNANAPAADITGVARPFGPTVDMGAYEFFVVDGKAAVGRLVSGAFVPVSAIPGAIGAQPAQAAFLAASSWGVVVQAVIPRNDYTKDSFVTNIRVIDAGDNEVGVGANVRMFRVSPVSDPEWIYQSRRPSDNAGKPVVFVDNLAMEGDKPEGYFIRAVQDGRLKGITSVKQF